MNVSVRDRAIILGYEEEGYSTSFLSRRYSISMRQVQNILKTNNIELRKQTNTGGVVSKLHCTVGTNIYYYRNLANLTHKDFDMPLRRLRSIEKGTHDLTLVDLQKISELLGVNIAEIVTGK